MSCRRGTIYDFEGDHVHVRLTFLTPALPDDLDVLARPLTYLTWEVNSTGDRPMRVSILTGGQRFDRGGSAGPAGCLVAGGDRADSRRFASERSARRGASAAGDDTRIDWGYLYLAAPTAGLSNGRHTRGDREAVRSEGVLRRKRAGCQADSRHLEQPRSRAGHRIRRIPGRQDRRVAASS